MKRINWSGRGVAATSAGAGGLALGYGASLLVPALGSPLFWDIAAQPVATAFAGIGAISAGYLAFQMAKRVGGWMRSTTGRMRSATASQTSEIDTPLQRPSSPITIRRSAKRVRMRLLRSLMTGFDSALPAIKALERARSSKFA
ncbi:hypothetical protein [Rhodococcus sp. 3A]|uniref:hypothetical protein n=1 Tax=Rhodococcus sp. 3A TaxID=2834581 RepID=UPI0002A3A0EC|nr:hypothetical protein [Rhodococcus sp. 3A]ELB95095.1 hypothetical protein Rwratislav_00755 [Rhodococcus wratislaviensis IFP 2016]